MRKYQKLIKKRGSAKLILHFLGIVVVAMVAAQLVYPYNRGLPLASVGGQSVRMETYEDIAKVVTEKFSATKVKLSVGHDKSVEFDVKSAGAEPNTEAMVARASNYPLWQRLIPGSFLWQQDRVISADIYFANRPFSEFIEARSKELSFPFQNARLTIADGQIKADEAVEGSEVDAAGLLQSVSTAQLSLGGTTEIQAPSRRIEAQRYARDFDQVRAQAEAALAHAVTIKAGERSFSPVKEEQASWLLVGEDDKNNVTLSVDKGRVKTYLESIDNEVGTPPGQTNITIIDGRETGRTPGATGRALAKDSMADRIAVALLQTPNNLIVDAEFTDVQPSVIYNSKYTTTQQGLQAYLDDLGRTKNIRVSIQQLDGGKWVASTRANESIPSGSTYKLFVALVLFDRINKGEIHWDDPMLDTTVAGCFDRMTVASTNPCAESWIAQFGRQYINDFVYARGFSSGTSFTTGSANQTTAADLTKYMIGLNDGTLVSGANRDRLLNNLGRHPYRYGIPTGSKGRVNDKVGFLWDYIHDTAIVHHPQGTYILTVMTKGYSYATIASVTREIERIMYP